MFVRTRRWERDLKLKVIEIYNTKLDGRAERKKFILERGLLDRKEKKRSKEEREVYNNMRVFARFQAAEEHEAFIQGLLSQQTHARCALIVGDRVASACAHFSFFLLASSCI